MGYTNAAAIAHISATPPEPRKSAIVSYMESVAEIQGQSPEFADAQLATLLVAIGRHDRPAFEQFYNATAARVLGLALRVAQRRDLAEEVVCDVFVHVWENPGQYDADRGSVMAWLMTVCRSRAIDALRREQSRSGSKDRDEALRAEQGDCDDDPQDLLQAVDRESRVYEALTKLSADDRQLVSLAFFKGYSHAEIAGFTAMPLGTVKTRVRRALIALRGYLENE